MPHSGFCIFGSGDIIAQNIFQSKDKSDDVARSQSIEIDRVLRTASLGFVMNGLVLFNWYKLLDSKIGVSMKNRNTVMAKMFADQVVYAPFSIMVFFTTSSIHPDGSLAQWFDDVSLKMKDAFVSTYLADCALWPLVNFFNFRFIPLHLRPTFVGIAQLLWQTYLSFIAHRVVEKQTNDWDILSRLQSLTLTLFTWFRGVDNREYIFKSYEI